MLTKRLLSKNKLTRLFLASVVTCSFALLPLASKAFGVSPGYIELNQLKANSSAEVNFSISRAKPTTEDAVTISATGNGQSAVVLSNTTISLPAGETSVEYTLRLEPRDYLPGSYLANISFIYEPKQAAKLSAGTTIAAGVTTQITFTVTDQTTHDLSIDGIELVNTETSSPVLQYTLTNNGNEPDQLGEILLTYTNNLESNTTVRFGSDQLPSVAPFSNEIFTIPLKTDLSPGQYEITAMFYGLDRAIVHEKSSLHWQIPAVTDPAETTNTEPTNKSLPWMIALIGTAAVTISVVVFRLWYTK